MKNSSHKLMNSAFYMKCLLIIALVLMSFTAVGGNVPVQRKKVTIRTMILNKNMYLNMADVAAFYGMNMSLKPKTVLFSSRYSTFLFSINGRILNLNNVQIHLSRPILEYNGSYYLGKSDFQLLMEPILRPKAVIQKHQIRTILVDPGHGGKDVGAISGKDYEKNINLQVALRLAKKLQAKGYNVCMTRNKDTDITLQQRTDFSDKIKADLFISIHCNSAAATANGIETFIATPLGDPGVGENTSAKTECKANAFDKANAYLAYNAQRALIQKTHAADRGLRRKRFFVIRNTNCPSMLIEIGFITNPQELQALKQPLRQDQIADAIVDAVTKLATN